MQALSSGPTSLCSQAMVAGIEVGAENQIVRPGTRLDPTNIGVRSNGANEISVMRGKVSY